jgi:hypothetical protein
LAPLLIIPRTRALQTYLDTSGKVVLDAFRDFAVNADVLGQLLFIGFGTLMMKESPEQWIRNYFPANDATVFTHWWRATKPGTKNKTSFFVLENFLGRSSVE